MLLTLDLCCVGSQLDVDDLFPTITFECEDPQQDRGLRLDLIRTRNRATVLETSRRDNLCLSAQAIAELDRLGRTTLRPQLQALGWTLGAVLQACAMHRRCNIHVREQGDAFGPAATFDDARAAAASAGLRGELFTILEGDGSGLVEDVASIFTYHLDFPHLAPGVERAISAVAVARLGRAETCWLDEQLRSDLVAWLGRTAAGGRASTFGKHRLHLTLALATIRRSGLSAMLSEGLVPLASLRSELEVWSDGMSSDAARSASLIVLDHLSGLSASGIASSHDTSKSRVAHMIVRYRAVGPVGLSQSGRMPDVKRYLRSKIPWRDIVAELKGSLGPGKVPTLVDAAAACAASYGRVLDLQTVARGLAEVDITLPKNRASARPSRVQAKANWFTGLSFEAND